MPKEKRRPRTRVQVTSKVPTIYDVAREARVSVFTVSRVINQNERVSTPFRLQVQAAIHKLNYRPNLLARNLAKQQRHTIGVAVPDIANPSVHTVVRASELMDDECGELKQFP